MRLKDKIILVTGSTTGIGEAIARRCTLEGAAVMVHGLEAEMARNVAGSLAGAAYHCNDLARPDSAAELIDATIKSLGRLDAIVNNAAWVVRSNIETTDVALFDRCMAINVRAPMLLFKHALPHLKQARGCVLNIGSINAYTGEANQLAYSVSKGALMTLSRNLADAHARDQVRVNHFNLGWVLSENEYKLKMREGLPPDWPDKVPPAFAPSGRILTPAHVAAAAVYWLSDESRPISGSVLELEQYPMIGRNPVKEGK